MKTCGSVYSYNPVKWTATTVHDTSAIFLLMGKSGKIEMVNDSPRWRSYGYMLATLWEWYSATPQQVISGPHLSSCSYI